jgi:hypothetical protein
VDDRVTILVRIAVVLVFVVVTSAPAWAQKTDVVTLPNGDRNTGEILELERGDLKFETDDAGTIVFDWEKIATVEAARQFEVVTSDGRHFLGRLGRSSAGSVLIVSLNDSVTLSLAEVTRIRPIGASLWSRLDDSPGVVAGIRPDGCREYFSGQPATEMAESCRLEKTAQRYR